MQTDQEAWFESGRVIATGGATCRRLEGLPEPQSLKRRFATAWFSPRPHKHLVQLWEGEVNLVAGKVRLDWHGALAIGAERLLLEREERLKRFIAGWEELDRRVFKLMQCGQRNAEVDARLLGISHLPLEEQRRQINRKKQQVVVRAKRWARRLPSE